VRPEINLPVSAWKSRAGLAGSADGALYIGDNENHRIRGSRRGEQQLAAESEHAS